MSREAASVCQSHFAMAITAAAEVLQKLFQYSRYKTLDGQECLMQIDSSSLTHTFTCFPLHLTWEVLKSYSSIILIT